MAQVLRERAAAAQALDEQIAQLIEQAVQQILARLAGAPSDYQQWVLPRLLDGVRRVAEELAATADPKVQQALQAVWDLGERLINDPVLAAHQVETAAGGISSSPLAGLQVPDLRQLRAMQAFSTSQISGATADMVKAVNRELGQVVIGGKTPFEALKAVKETLPDRTTAQLRTIVNSNLSAAFTTSAFDTLKAQAARDPDIKKQWRRSGKLRARWNHAAADGQVQEVDKPFVLTAHNRKGTVELMHPADPKGPLGEILNCGCVALAWKKSWRMKTPATVPEKGSGSAS